VVLSSTLAVKVIHAPQLCLKNLIYAAQGGRAATMVIPLYDVDPIEGWTKPYVTYGLIATNMLVAVCVLTQPHATYQSIVIVWALIPAVETRELPSNSA
jgi:hypothetical protein